MMHLFVSSHVLSLIINYLTDRSNHLLTEDMVLAVQQSHVHFHFAYRLSSYFIFTVYSSVV